MKRHRNITITHLTRLFTYSLFFLASVMILGLGGCGKNKKVDSAKARRLTHQTLDSLKKISFLAQYGLSERLQLTLDSFYTNREYDLAWINEKGVFPQTGALLAAIDQAGEEGLEPDDYNRKTIRTLQTQLFGPDAQDKKASQSDRLSRLIHFDFLLTSSYLQYASHLLSGRINPQRLEATWKYMPRRRNLAATLQNAIEKNTIAQSLASMVPHHEQYPKLKTQLARYRQIEAKGGWPQIDAGNLNPETLGRRLAITGDLDSSASQGNLRIKMASFSPDSTLTVALRRFQNRHGLKPTGQMDETTLAAMNVPVGRRIEQIVLNMERLRWHPDSLGERYIRVNVPEFELAVIEKGKTTLGMRVIVGKEYNATPIFSDTITYLVFSPDWTVPKSIIEKELAPKILSNPDYLATSPFTLYQTWKNNDTVPVDIASVDWASITPENFPYRVVQKPGPSNPLGAVKFVFPNNMSIYLHDTPNDRLFNVQNRELSHGCVRLERPMELANYLLKTNKQEWKKETLDSMAHLPKPTIVKLTQKIPVQLAYWTAWVDEQGQLNFRQDVYGHDQEQLAALAKRKKPV